MSTPEAGARQRIDAQLLAAGWVVQDRADLNLTAALGVAVREFPTLVGPADYLLFTDGLAVGVLEAKKGGQPLSGVSDQTQRYQRNLGPHARAVASPLPFGLESDGENTFYRDLREPDSASRRVFNVPQPATLARLARQTSTLRGRLRSLPPLAAGGLRDCQFEAVNGLEDLFRAGQDRALIEMATGAGKTFTAVTGVYRLLKHAQARRVLFLVDRGNLGRQALREFQNYRAPDGVKFTDAYNVQLLSSNAIDGASSVIITTIQRLYSILKGEADLDATADELSGFDGALPKEPPRVVYNAAIPPEFFDLIVVDECHRSIYSTWRQVLDYFDALLLGLTATPGLHTYAFFHQNVASQYSFARSVQDQVNVGFDVWRIRTKVSEAASAEDGLRVSADPLLPVYTRDRRSGAQDYAALDEDLTYHLQDLDRSVVNPSQMRTIVAAVRDALPKLFPGRHEVPKTLFFAKDDRHADDLVGIIREVFGKGNDFCKKITYSADNPEQTIKNFRTSQNPRVVVTVDMIATGTDVKPLEVLVFMRDVRSAQYFTQMLGRGARTIDPLLLADVTPSAVVKDHFVVFDAVGVFESVKPPSQPQDPRVTTPLKALLEHVATGDRTPDTLGSLAARLERLSLRLSPADTATLTALAGGEALPALAARLRAAQTAANSDAPTPEDLQAIETATRPFNNPTLRQAILSAQRRAVQVIDEQNLDELLSLEGIPVNRAEQDTQTFKQFIETHRDELTALQLLYSQPQAQHAATLRDLRQLRDTLLLEHPTLTPAHLWAAYERLNQGKVRHARAAAQLTNLISLVRYATGQTDTLASYPDLVQERFLAWLSEQQACGRSFTPTQRHWLDMMSEHIAASLNLVPDDLDLTPFDAAGGLYAARRHFDNLEEIMQQLTTALAA